MDPSPTSGSAESEVINAPREPLGKLFLRFLRFGALAWGGPVAQIDMIRQELVAEEKWISAAHFKRLLAIYQVLPGPEAHELCVHFGMMSRGRIGGILAGLGFMLPGFVLMFVLSWVYLSLNLTTTAFQAVFLGIQPAVIALIVRACHRIGGHCLTDGPLWAIGSLAAVATALGLSFYLTLLLAGVAYMVAQQRKNLSVGLMAILVAAAGWQFWLRLEAQNASAEPGRPPTLVQTQATSGPGPQPVQLFGSGLRAGLLTFGGAYTAIPFLRADAVETGRWMTERDFLDGVALSGILPAPLIIFSTFVGYFGGGPLGALAMTVGVFLPAFGFSLLFYRRLETLMHHRRLRHFLDGVTAGVVGLIAITTVELGLAAIGSFKALGIFAAALAALYVWKSKFAIPALIALAGAAGALLFTS